VFRRKSARRSSSPSTARGASEADGGYGLGLSLVRQIARRHGGEVRCVGRPRSGCIFRVTLPGRITPPRHPAE